MGNRNANDEQNNNVNINGGVHEHILIENENNNNQKKLDPPSVKKIHAVRNPFSIKKNSLILEKDAGHTNLYYIKFIYDSLVNFNCYINFEVSKNHSKPLVPKDLSNSDNYILSYIPSDNFVSKSISIKNLPKGENKEFFEKEAVIDIEYFKTNKSQNKNNNEQIYDVSIELVPIFEENINNNKNEIVYLFLCNLEQEDIERHPHSLKIDLQKLKTYGLWIELHDIYNTALENGECLICCTNLRNTIFLPCNHACTCNTCAHSLKMRNNPCPICKNQIKDLLILEVDEKNENINTNINFSGVNNNEIKNADIININENNNIMNNNNDNINDEEERIKINEE